MKEWRTNTEQLKKKYTYNFQASYLDAKLN